MAPQNNDYDGATVASKQQEQNNNSIDPKCVILPQQQNNTKSNNLQTDKLTGSVQMAPNEQLIRQPAHSNPHASQITLNVQAESSRQSAGSSCELSSCCDSGDSAAKFSNPPWWHRRTRLERLLCVLAFVAVLLSVVLIALLAKISLTSVVHKDNGTTHIGSTLADLTRSILPGAHHQHQQQASDENGNSLPNTSGDSVGPHHDEQQLTQVAGALVSLRGIPVPTQVGRLGKQRTGKQLFATADANGVESPDGGSPAPAQTASDNRAHQPGEPANYGKSGGDVCLTPGCVKAAAEILKNMDEKVDPCDDFYRYSCGNWIDTQVIPEDKTSVSLFSVVQDELDNKLRNLIEKKPEDAAAAANETPIIGKMRNLYESCMNTTHIEAIANEPLLKTIKELGGWPVLGSSSGWTGEREKSFDWLDLLIKFRQMGFSHDVLIDLSVTPDFRNNTKHIIDLDQVSLGMPDRSYLLKGLNDTAVAAYYNLMIESAVLLGAERRDAETQMLDALAFETQLANYSLPREERRNISSLYNKMKLSQLHTIAPNIDWNKYLGNLLDQPLSQDEEVIVNVPTFFTKVDKLLTEVNSKTLANYMMWRVVLQSVSVLGKKWRELAQTYNAVITGQEREEPRWEQCLSSLTGTLGIAISSMYVKNHFKSDSKEQAMEMVDYIRKEFTNILDEVDWMDDQTRQEAKEKAEAISSYIGYPDELLNDTMIEDLYSGLELNKGHYFDNILNLRKWSTDYSFRQLRKPNLKVDWRKHARAATVNAFYNSLDNSIEFPAGILQGAFFDKSKPNYLNFGAIGFVIGHEITHGFDDRGRQFDKDGNNRNWWNSDTDQRFKERAQCIIDQYSNYTVPENGLRVNGINTQGENIADNGGLKEAFRAYDQWIRRNGVEPTLPGIKLSQKQLFWVSAANVWCGKYRSEVLKMRVLVGSHSPAQFRITGPLSNLKEFSETFNCPAGAPLNPAKKCSVW